MADRQGYFVLADVSGYTSFLAQNELEHAQAVLGNLLNLLIGELTPTLELVEVEGDAIFAYAPLDRLERGETLLELLELMYVHFCDRLLEMQRDTTCGCRACEAIPDLDLKCVVHCGPYALQDVADRRKPVGSAVTLAHRLLKNGVRERTGWPAYVLFSDAAREALGLASEGLEHGEESYEHLGTTTVWALDLRARGEALRAAGREQVSRDAAHVTLQRTLDAAPAHVWTWLNSPERRGAWIQGTTWTDGLRPGGRTGPGAENHCAHRSGTALERVLDWRPFETFTTETRQGPLRLQQTFVLAPVDDGAHTALEVRSRLAWALPRLLARPLGALFVRISGLSRSLETLEQLIGAESVGTS